MTKENLREISERVGSNKLQHNYEPVYDRHFQDIREKKLKILEIGVWEGNSLRMWKDYFPNAEVSGFDIHSSRMVKGEDRIKTMVVDQSNRKDLSKAMSELGEFYIIIDDGSHSVDNHQISFGYLFPFVKSKGFYVIEDVHTSFHYTNGEYLSDITIKTLKDVYGVSDDFYNTTYNMLRNYQEFG